MNNHPDWGEGPWNTEPDHDVWVDELTDLDCMINRGPSGAWCGYVGIGPDHPWHGKNWADLEDDINVHGGLTYSEACQEGGEICHVPEPGREHDIWWLGFDCAHCGDLSPAFAHRYREWGITTHRHEMYKTRDYATAEVSRLATQLAVMK